MTRWCRFCAVDVDVPEVTVHLRNEDAPAGTISTVDFRCPDCGRTNCAPIPGNPSSARYRAALGGMIDAASESLYGRGFH